MSDAGDSFSLLMWMWIVFALAISVVLVRFPAPYGRYSQAKWGRRIPARLGWVLMESPSLLLMVGFFATGQSPWSVASVIFVSLWAGHYAHRSLIYPFRTHGPGSHKMPVVIVAMGILFNCLNASSNGWFLFHHAPRGADWLQRPLLWAGVAVFLIGMGINVWADGHLRALRRRSNGEYVLPTRGLYRFVSCPNYLGEITEWLGFAIATWSLSGFAFFVWTAANLAPRAISHHRFYKQRFGAEMPTTTRALVPFVL